MRKSINKNIMLHVNQQIENKLTLILVIILFIGSLTCYIVFFRNPWEKKQRYDEVIITDYLNKIKKNFKIFDLSEIIRISQTFNFPEEVIDIAIRGAKNSTYFQKNFNYAVNFNQQNHLKYELLVKDFNIYEVHRYHFNAEELGDKIHVQLIANASHSFLLYLRRTVVALLIFYAFCIWGYFYMRKTLKNIFRPLRNLSSYLDNLYNRQEVFQGEDFIPQDIAGVSIEVSKVIHSYNQLITKNHTLLKNLLENEHQNKIVQEKAFLAKQVSHDIRSPLTALEIIMSDTQELPEQKRTIVRYATRRIKDIANNLLQDYKNTYTSSDEVIPCLLSQVTENLLSEKRTNLQKTNIEICFDLDYHSYGLFTCVNAKKLRRVLSNIIDNSIEAINNQGRISISLYAKNNFCTLEIQDTGCGIPHNILTKVTTQGFTHGKKGSGHGLGLSYALQCMKSWGGNLLIDSKMGTGTSVKLIFPQIETPEWFLPKLNIVKGQKVIILDDDLSIHEVWKKRFSQYDVELHNFISPNSIEKWFAAHHHPNNLYLFDYEILPAQESGLELAQRLKIIEQTTLVTSYFEEESLQKKCHALGLKGFLKNLASIIPISYVSRDDYAQESFSHEKENILYC